MKTAHILESLRAGRTTLWRNPAVVTAIDRPALTRLVEKARDRFDRFAPLLAHLFPDMGPAGRIASPLIAWTGAPITTGPMFVKADHALPITGSVKARGGIHDVLGFVERAAAAEGLIEIGGDLSALLEPRARERLASYRVTVASTGNLGFSVGIAARAFGLGAEIHMSADAKAWKKARLTAIGAEVIEYAGDYGAAVRGARKASGQDDRVYFVDDERSIDLFAGYAVAARELADQLDAAEVAVTRRRPLTVYLPCGVGGAPGGIAFGLRAIYGEALRAVFVEPVASPCMMIALAEGNGKSVSVYDRGLDNRTLADGLAVAEASELVLDAVGPSIDAAVAVPDGMMVDWVVRAHREMALRLEPSAASALAAIDVVGSIGEAADAAGTHVAWLTGGSLLPDHEFHALVGADTTP